MSRDVTSQVDTDVVADLIQPFFTFRFEFDSGTLLLWSGHGTKTIAGEDHIGSGILLSVSDIEETAQLDARGVTLVMTSLDPSILSLALSEPYQGRPASISMGVMSDFSEVTELFSGYMDTMELDEGVDTCSVKMTIENKLIELERSKVHRYTSAYQKSRFPGDKGFDFVEDLQDKRVPWGRSSN